MEIQRNSKLSFIMPTELYKNKNKNFSIRFIVKDRCTSYTSAQRSLIVMQILLRAKFDDSEKV